MKAPSSKSMKFLAALGLALALAASATAAEKSKPPKKPKDKAGSARTALSFPPKLPDGKDVVTHTSEEFLQSPSTLQAGVTVAKTPPTIDFAFFPGQDYPGKPWSVWGDGIVANGKYYASIGDHLAPGNAYVYEYDPAMKKFRLLVDLKKTLNLPEGHYTPAKVHGRLDMGEDGWLYFSTHRGSSKVTTDEYHYKGDWIVRHHPRSGKTELLAQGPVPKHCIPCSMLDPKRLIFYGGTAPGSGSENEGGQFLAYDVRGKKVLYSGPDGPSRYMMFAKSTGRIYYTQGKKETGPLMRYDPDRGGAPVRIPGEIGCRAATAETAQGFIYTVSNGHGNAEAFLYAFNTRTEEIENLGPAVVASQNYITSLDVDPTGRFLYYIPGAHGGSELDGSAVVQFDVQTRQKKVVAFLHPFFEKKYGSTLKGTFSSALDAKGEKLYITWNNSRDSREWDSTVLTVIHLPPSEIKAIAKR